MANIKADEITQILREQIENYESKIAVDEVGTPGIAERSSGTNFFLCSQ